MPLISSPDANALLRGWRLKSQTPQEDVWQAFEDVKQELERLRLLVSSARSHKQTCRELFETCDATLFQLTVAARARDVEQGFPTLSFATSQLLQATRRASFYVQKLGQPKGLHRLAAWARWRTLEGMLTAARYEIVSSLDHSLAAVTAPPATVDVHGHTAEPIPASTEESRIEAVGLNGGHKQQEELSTALALRSFEPGKLRGGGAQRGWVAALQFVPSLGGGVEQGAVQLIVQTNSGALEMLSPSVRGFHASFPLGGHTAALTAIVVDWSAGALWTCYSNGCACLMGLENQKQEQYSCSHAPITCAYAGIGALWIGDTEGRIVCLLQQPEPTVRVVTSREPTRPSGPISAVWAHDAAPIAVAADANGWLALINSEQYAVSDAACCREQYGAVTALASVAWVREGCGSRVHDNSAARQGVDAVLGGLPQEQRQRPPRCTGRGAAVGQDPSGGAGARDGWRLLTGHVSGLLVLWEAGGGKLCPVAVLGEKSAPIVGLSVAAELQLLVVGHRDGWLRVWPLPAPAMHLLPLPLSSAPHWALRHGVVRAHRSRMTALDRCGPRLATGSAAGGVRCWDLLDLRAQAMRQGAIFQSLSKPLGASRLFQVPGGVWPPSMASSVASQHGSRSHQQSAALQHQAAAPSEQHAGAMTETAMLTLTHVAAREPWNAPPGTSSSSVAVNGNFERCIVYDQSAQEDKQPTRLRRQQLKQPCQQPLQQEPIPLPSQAASATDTARQLQTAISSVHTGLPSGLLGFPLGTSTCAAEGAAPTSVSAASLNGTALNGPRSASSSTGAAGTGTNNALPYGPFGQLPTDSLGLLFPHSFVGAPILMPIATANGTPMWALVSPLSPGPGMGMALGPGAGSGLSGPVGPGGFRSLRSVREEEEEEAGLERHGDGYCEAGLIAGGGMNGGGDPEAMLMVLQDHWLDGSEVELVEEMDRGAEGRVWLGKWHHSSVAVKEMLPRSASRFATLAKQLAGGAGAASTLSPELQAALREVSCLVALSQHPAIVRFLGFVAQPVPRIIMEFYPGGSLFAVIERAREGSDAVARSQLAWMNRLSMLLDIAAGMAFLHDRGYLHGDLRSPNVFITTEGRAKVGDFGFARLLDGPDAVRDSRAQVEVRLTNPRWLAPEVIMEQASSQAGDVYSFAVIMFELLTWRVPYEDCDGNQVVARHSAAFDQLAHHPGSSSGGGGGREAFRPALPAEEVLPQVPRGTNSLAAYKQLMAECWAHCPHDRPSFGDIALRLQTLIQWEQSMSQAARDFYALLGQQQSSSDESFMRALTGGSPSLSSAQPPMDSAGTPVGSSFVPSARHSLGPSPSAFPAVSVGRPHANCWAVGAAQAAVGAAGGPSPIGRHSVSIANPLQQGSVTLALPPFEQQPSLNEHYQQRMLSCGAPLRSYGNASLGGAEVSFSPSPSPSTSSGNRSVTQVALTPTSIASFPQLSLPPGDSPDGLPQLGVASASAFDGPSSAAAAGPVESPAPLPYSSGPRSSQGGASSGRTSRRTTGTIHATASPVMVDLLLADGDGRLAHISGSATIAGGMGAQPIARSRLSSASSGIGAIASVLAGGGSADAGVTLPADMMNGGDEVCKAWGGHSFDEEEGEEDAVSMLAPTAAATEVLQQVVGRTRRTTALQTDTGEVIFIVQRPEAEGADAMIGKEPGSAGSGEAEGDAEQGDVVGELPQLLQHLVQQQHQQELAAAAAAGTASSHQLHPLPPVPPQGAAPAVLGPVPHSIALTRSSVVSSGAASAGGLGPASTSLASAIAHPGRRSSSAGSGVTVGVASVNSSAFNGSGAAGGVGGSAGNNSVASRGKGSLSLKAMSSLVAAVQSMPDDVASTLMAAQASVQSPGGGGTISAGGHLSGLLSGGCPPSPTALAHLHLQHGHTHTHQPYGSISPVGPAARGISPVASMTFRAPNSRFATRRDTRSSGSCSSIGPSAGVSGGGAGPQHTATSPAGRNAAALVGASLASAADGTAPRRPGLDDKRWQSDCSDGTAITTSTITTVATAGTHAFDSSNGGAAGPQAGAAAVERLVQRAPVTASMGLPPLMAPEPEAHESPWANAAMVALAMGLAEGDAALR